MDRTAIIDLGTNTFHLIIVEFTDDHQYKTLHREHKAVRIGEGGINASVITDAGAARALETLVTFKKRIDQFGVTKTQAFGTSAIRSATNRQQFVDLVFNQTSIAIRIISGDEEAALIYAGVRAAVDLQEDALIVDIGGGSVEFIIGNQKEIFWKHSFDIGGQRLLERFQKHDPISDEEVDSIFEYLMVELAPLVPVLKKYDPKVLVGSSGTFDTLSEMYCLDQHIEYHENDPETPLSIASFHKTFAQLRKKDRAARLLMPGMIELRVDMISVACCIIDFLLRNHSFSSIRVSTWSLKEGVLLSS